jgi:predicted alpha/beta hydrolase family esterase
MRTAEAEILCVPGPGAPDPDHWMRRWQSRLASATLIEPGEAAPALADWIAAIAGRVEAAERPIVFVAHGLGVHALAHAAQQMDFSRARGGFLVNPPAPAGLAALSGHGGEFARAPRAPLPFPSLLVASRDNPHGTFEDMRDLGLDWGSHVIDAGAVGHIDAASGHGPWPEGLMRFGAFLARL